MIKIAIVVRTNTFLPSFDFSIIFSRSTLLSSQLLKHLTEEDFLSIQQATMQQDMDIPPIRETSIQAMLVLHLLSPRLSAPTLLRPENSMIVER